MSYKSLATPYRGWPPYGTAPKGTGKKTEKNPKPRPQKHGLPPEWDGIELAYELDGTPIAQYGADSSPTGANLSIVLSAPTKYVGKIGDARGISGVSSDYELRSVANSICMGPEATVLLWFKPLVSTNFGPFVLERNTGTGIQFDFGLTGNTSTCYLYQLAYITERPHAGVGNWSFAAITMSATSGWSFSINNGTRATNPAVPLFATTQVRCALLTGKGTDGNCVVDLFRLFNRVLTADEITYHYNGGAGRAYGT